MGQTGMDLSSEAADANAAAGFELLAETFYSGMKRGAGELGYLAARARTPKGPRRVGL